MKEENYEIEFYGGRWISFLPFLIFIMIAIFLAIKQAPDLEGMWVAVLVGIIITFFFSKNKQNYSETIIDGLSDRVGMVPIACWLFVGVFATVLQESGLVEGIIWLIYSLGATGTTFVVISFLASGLFATSVGTAFGTIIAGMSVLYPAGVLLGGDPVLLAGAIASGGILGDNLAPISDTTICSATSQETDIGGVVRSRVKYVIPATVLSIIVFIILGSGGDVESVPYEKVAPYMNPVGLIMIIPALITIILALRGAHLIKASIYGTVSAVFIGLIFRLLTFDALFQVKDGEVNGAIASGISGMVEIIIFTLLLIISIKIMRKGKGSEALVESAKKIVKTARGAEMSTGFLVVAFSAIMGINAPAILAIGLSYAKPIGDKFNIHPYRMANILDGLGNTLAFTMPWTPTILLIHSQTVQANSEFGSSIPILSVSEIFPYLIYAWVLLVVMTIAVITGWGRKFSHNSIQNQNN